MKIKFLLAPTFCCALALSGCGSSDSTAEFAPTDNSTVVAPPPETTAAPAASGGKTYPNVRGQIAKIVQPKQAGESVAVEIDHEKVPDFMSAMRMTIPLQNASDAKMLKAGDKIRFDLVLSKGLEITNIKMLPADTKLTLAASAKMGVKP